MGQRTSYTPGTFCWVDLTTPDQPASKQFYSTLFGWDANDMPVGEGMVYSIMTLEDRSVAAISPQQPQQLEAGMPPNWNSYITVEDADAALAHAVELGATSTGDAFDVFDAGRMAGIFDPHGAFFLIWQPGQTPGAGLVNGPGQLCWNELQSPDPDASAAFYGELFGWRTTPMDGMPMQYLVIETADGRQNGGIVQAQPDWPTTWLAYFGTDDIDATIAVATEHGAAEILGATSIGPGTIAILSDPQGGMLSLYCGQFDD